MLAKLTGPRRYEERFSTFSTFIQKLVSNNDLTNFVSMSLCILVSLVSPFFYILTETLKEENYILYFAFANNVRHHTISYFIFFHPLYAF